MKSSVRIALPGVCAALFLGAAALAETKVELKGVHLCCGACVKGVATALKGVDGVKPACDRENGTVTITATDAATARKALDALAAAGYHGDTGDKGLNIKAESNVPSGKVSKLSLTNAHNCCGSCCKAIKASVKKVAGVSGDTAKPKTANFEVTGDFDAAEVVKALNDAGFHVQVRP
jgi:copper chaperone CopZ